MATPQQQSERDCAAFILSGIVQSVISNGKLTDFDVETMKAGVNDLRCAHGMPLRYDTNRENVDA